MTYFRIPATFARKQAAGSWPHGYAAARGDIALHDTGPILTCWPYSAGYERYRHLDEGASPSYISLGMRRHAGN